MKLCRFETAQKEVHVGLVEGGRIVDFANAGITNLSNLLEAVDLELELSRLDKRKLPSHAVSDVRILAPVERQEVWAVGVTYLRSKKARMEESDFSATAYDKVY